MIEFNNFFDKRTMKTIKVNGKGTELKSLSLLKKTKTIKDKIEIHNNFDKMIKKKIKVEKPNRKTLYIQVKKQGLS
jgi:hypothetical protein